MNEGEEEYGSNRGDGRNEDSGAILNQTSAKLPKLHDIGFVLQMEGKGGAYLIGLSQFNLET
eukprot:14912893-Ditylum_brightwellii.AAC.1